MNVGLSIDTPYSRRQLPYLYWLLMLCVLNLFVVRFSFQYDSSIAYVLFLLFLYPIVTVLRFEEKATVALSFIVFTIAKLYYLFTLNPVTNPDSINFIGYYQLFNGYSAFISQFWDDLVHNLINSSIYNTFGFLYITFFQIIGSTNPVAMNVYNTILTIATVYLMYRIVKKHFAYEIGNKELFTKIFVALCFVSPSLLYWSSIVRKDITILFFTVLSLHLLLEKRFAWFIIVSFYALTIRKYTIIPVILYYVMFKKMPRAALWGSLVSLAIVLYMSGSVGVANTFYTLGISLFSPNPFSLENWSIYGYRTLESVVVLFGLILSVIVFMKQKESRKFFYMLLGCIFSYTCLLNLVGYDAAQYFGVDYRFGATGDDLSRKKLMIVFMIYMMIAYSVGSITRPKIR